MIDKARLYYLLTHYRDGNASAEEAAEMFEMIRMAEGEELFRDFIADNSGNETGLSAPVHANWDKMWSVIHASVRGKKKTPVLVLPRLKTAAAAILLLAVAGAVFLSTGKKKEMAGSFSTTGNNPKLKEDLLPGGNRAMLTLADGSTIVLDSMQNGSLAKQGNVNILKLNAGRLAYNGSNRKEGEVLYNRISTPRGGQYQVILADGTLVWLNAASSLYFPTSFTGKERTVELTGEGYFEVAKNKSMPFHVKVNGMDVRVTGTHFNVMAYQDEENIKTTLLEGSVTVIPAAGNEQRLEPGRQAIVDNNTRTIKMKNADIEQVMAWKNGFFRFKETNIREVMRQAARWYDVDIDYRTAGNEQDYTGIIPRSQNASALLQTLELTGTVHFRIEGKKIIVLP